MLNHFQSNRRQFLKQTVGGSLALGLGCAAPELLTRAAMAADQAGGERVLVVVQLTGGNDGLNTVVPYTDDEYRRQRPKLAIPTDRLLKLNDQLGLHPAARGLADLWEDNKLAIVQGVGYPQPNRSHFESMDIWHSCLRKETPRADGWIGRYLEQAGPARSDAPAVHLGQGKQPLALAARDVRVPSIASLERFRLQAEDTNVRAAIADLAAAKPSSNDELLGFLQSSTAAAISASERVDQARRGYETPIAYPENALAEKLRTVAQLIDAGLQTRVYYVELDGFDTHAQQPDAHTALLGQFADSTRAFQRDIEHHGHGDRVLVVSFSEFGRRVAENASDGTDHGAAGPMFLAGNRVRPGTIGDHPSLTDLQDGDLKHAIDFRQVYAAILESWLGCASEPVLGERYDPVPAIA